MVVGIRSVLACLASAVLVSACTGLDTSDSDQADHHGSGSGSGCTSGCGSGSGSGSGSGTEEDNYVVKELVTSATDPDLKNPWGIVGAEGVFWIADNVTGKVSVYDGDGQRSDEYPTGHFVPGEGITGVAAMESDEEEGGAADEFLIDTGVSCPDLTAAEFVFASEDGKLIAINDESPRAGVVAADQSSAGAAYLGVAKVEMPEGAVLLAANFPNAKIDIFDDEFKLVDNKAGAFVDDEMPAGFGPFNVMAIEDRVYVMYAKIGPDGDEVAGPGLGQVSIFDTSGKLVGRIKSDLLNAPWGLAVKEEDGESIILVGNFGDGHITEVNAETLEVEEQLSQDGMPISYEGLWGITMGSEAAGDEDALYFVAGTEDETEGVFGRIDTAP
jgi:uncharacterized protein (TIGR03118 family)